MLLPIFGTPSQLSQWIVDLSNLVAEVIWGERTFIAASNVDQLKEQWSNRSAKAVVFFSDSPQKPLTELFFNSRGAVIVVYEPAASVADYVRRTRSLDVQTSLRFTTQSICTIAGLAKKPGAWLIDGSCRTLRVIDFIDSFVSYFQLSPTPEQLAAIRARALGPMNEKAIISSFIDQHLAPKNEASELEDVPTLIASVAPQYDGVVQGAVPKRFIWPKNVFVRMSDLEYLSGSLDLTGSARVLVSGHSLSLPRGRWRAVPIIKIARNESRNSIQSDIFAEDQLVAGITSKLPEKGRYEYSIDFTCQDPHYPIIFRISTQEGAIEGSLDLEGVVFERLDEFD